MKVWVGTLLLILILLPASVQGLSIDISDAPHACQIRGEVKDIEWQEAYIDDAFQVSLPDRYVLTVHITSLGNPHNENSHGNPCSSFFKIDQEATIYMYAMIVHLGERPNYGETIAGTTTGYWLTDYELGTYALVDRTANIIAWSAFLFGMLTLVFAHIHSRRK